MGKASIEFDVALSTGALLAIGSSVTAILLGSAVIVAAARMRVSAGSAGRSVAHY